MMNETPLGKSTEYADQYDPDLLVWDVPGVLIGGQIRPRLQSLISQQTMQHVIAILFVVLAVAMLFVAEQKAGLSILGTTNV